MYEVFKVQNFASIFVCFWRRIRRQFEFPAAQYFKTVGKQTFKTSVFLHKSEQNVKFEARVK